MVLPIYLLTLQQLSYWNYLTAIDQPIKDLLESVNFIDVQFIVQSPFRSNLEIAEGIYKTVAEAVPTSYISLNDSIPKELPSFHVSQGTLIIYLYIAENPLDHQQRENIVRVVERADSRPRILLITILEEQDCNFEQLLQEMWRKSFIDAMILELSSPDGRAIAIKAHQYNPFTDVYEQQPYDSSVQWFPDKITNLHGYPLNVVMVPRVGYVILQLNSQHYPVIYKGPDVDTMNAFARSLNLTVVLNPSTSDLFERMIEGKVDMAVPMLPFFNNVPYQNLDYTLPLSNEEWCPVVPIEYKHRNTRIRAFIGLAINWCMILVFWGVSVILKFDSYSWEPWKIFGMMISTSMKLRLKKTSERIVFLNVMLVSSIYSANLFVDLTSTTVTGRAEVDYNSFKELDESGLIPVVLNVLLNATFVSGDKYFLALKRKAIGMHALQKCETYLAEHKNVTCFMELKMANQILFSHAHDGKAVMKICRNLCYAQPMISYFLKKHLPYRDRFFDILIRLEAGGIRNKWYHDFNGKYLRRRRRFTNVDDMERHSLLWTLIYIARFGFTLSFLVFLGELLVRHIQKNKEKKKL